MRGTGPFLLLLIVVDGPAPTTRANNNALVFGERPADPAAVGAWLRDLRAVRRRARRSAGLPAALVARTDPSGSPEHHPTGGPP